MRHLFFAAAIAGAAFAMPANGYEIGSENPVKPADDIHETITQLAEECLAAAPAGPIDCRSYLPRIASESTRHQREPSTSLVYATRWPDDPTRMLDSARSAPKFGVTLFRDCGPYIGSGQRIDQAGMLCSSHYGRLSFLHAMQQPGMGETPAQTRELMLAGASFAFDVATDDAVRTANYCQAVAALPSARLRDALTLADEGKCERRRKRFLFIPTGWYEPWTVQTMFAFECRNPIGSGRCGEGTGDLGRDRAVSAATGAILHMIQDSFSQSHVYRAPTAAGADEDGPFQPRIVCQAPQAFFDYNVQMAAGSKVHSAADSDPEIDSSCTEAGRAVDDPITATANAIRFIRAGDRAAFDAYLAARVFPAA